MCNIIAMESSFILFIWFHQLQISKGAMVNLAATARRYWVHLFVPAGFVIGWYLDKLQDQKLTAFRNKSALFGRELKPGEEVTWR